MDGTSNLTHTGQQDPPLNHMMSHDHGKLVFLWLGSGSARRKLWVFWQALLFNIWAAALHGPIPHPTPTGHWVECNHWALPGLARIQKRSKQKFRPSISRGIIIAEKLWRIPFLSSGFLLYHYFWHISLGIKFCHLEVSPSENVELKSYEEPNTSLSLNRLTVKWFL